MKKTLALLLACLLSLSFALAEESGALFIESAQVIADDAEAGVAEINGLLLANAEDTPSEDEGTDPQDDTPDPPSEGEETDPQDDTPDPPSEGEETDPQDDIPDPPAEGEETDPQDDIPDPPVDEPVEVPPTAIVLKKSATRTVYLGTAYRFTVSGKKVKSYVSSSKKIATVGKTTGLITLKKTGKVKITAKLKNRRKVVLTLKVADPAIPASISISEGKKGKLIIGDTLQLTAVIAPATADQSVTWTSSDKAVATVDENGLVTPLRSGSTTITATTSNKKKAAYALTVRRPATAPHMISHAAGGLDGYDYTNCLEGFLENYAEGFRVFEMDLQFTSDGKVVLCHDWNRKMFSGHKAGTAPTYAQFMSAKIYDRYTPMDVTDLLKLMAAHPDMTVYIDSKNWDDASVKKEYTAIVSTAKQLGLEGVLDQFIAELYNKNTIKTIKSIYPFKSYTLTLYRMFKKAPTKSQLKNVASYCQKNGITGISMYAKWWKTSYKSILNQYDIDVSLHPVNDASKARKYFKQGVTALFTDFLPPLTK